MQCVHKTGNVTSLGNYINYFCPYPVLSVFKPRLPVVECAVCKGLASFMTGVSPIYQESKFIVGRVLFYTDYKRRMYKFCYYLFLAGPILMLFSVFRIRIMWFHVPFCFIGLYDFCTPWVKLENSNNF